MANIPNIILGNQTIKSELVSAPAPKTSAIFKKKTYTNIKVIPMAKLIPIPPLRFFEANATAIKVKMYEDTGKLVRL